MEQLVQKYIEDVFDKAGEQEDDTAAMIRSLVERNRGDRECILVLLDGEISDCFKDYKWINPRESPQWINEVRPNTHYVIVWSSQYSREFDDDLVMRGFREMTDFLFREPKPIELSGSFGYYQDERGNEVYNMRPNVRVTLAGYGNKLHLPRNMSFGSMSFVLNDRSKITMKAGISFAGHVHIHSLGSCTVLLGRSRFEPNTIIDMGEYSSLLIGDNCLLGMNLRVEVNEFHALKIGNDVLTSWDVTFQCGDGHGIFDSFEQRKLNYLKKRQKQQSIILGDHIWIGQKACIMRDTVLGSGSIIGAYSIVKGTFENNSLIIGSPGKKRRENRSWSWFPSATVEQIPTLYSLPTQHLSHQLLRFNWIQSLAEYCVEIAQAKHLICIIAVMDIVGHWIRGENRNHYR